MNPEINPANYQTVSATSRFRIAMVLFLASALMIGAVAYLSVNPQLVGDLMEMEGSAILDVSYLEDPAGALTLQEVQGIDPTADPGSYQAGWIPGDQVRIGSSRSTWWVRVRTDDLLAATQGEDRLYFSILNPSVEQVAFYLPNASSQNGAHPGYQLLESGWGVPHESHGDEGGSYPVFRLSSKIPAGEFTYLRLNSRYTQNYTFKLFSEQAFLRNQKIQTAMITFFVGFLVAMGVNNLIQYVTLGVSAHLYYLLYLFFLLLYQGSVLGFSRLFLGRFAEILVSGIAPIGMGLFISALLFFRSVLETRKNFTLAHRLSGIAILCFLADLAVYLAGFRYEANLLTLLLANLSSLIMITTAFRATRKKISQAKYLFAGYLVILLVSLVFNARAIGLLPNGELTTFIILFPTAIEAVLLSIGVSELLDQIRRDREQAMQQYRFAEGQVLSKESAFLQAQIRPHFLYNALNVIEALCYLDGRKAGELIQDLSKFLRHSFDFRNQEPYIDFAEELEYIQAYVKIEKVRFRDKLNVVFDLDEVGGLKLPPLLLQPLIENAILHGIRPRGGIGTVKICVRNLEDAYEIQVEDDGMGMTGEQVSAALSREFGETQSVGLANIQMRLQMFYGTGLAIESAPGKGTRVTVVLPKNAASKKGDCAG